MDKQTVAYPHNGYHSAWKEKEILVYAITWINLEGTICAKEIR